RDAGGEGHFTRRTDGAVLRHEEGAATGYALDGAEEAAATAMLGVGGHLDGGRHPGELASLRDDGVVGAEGELEDRHGGAENAILHRGSPDLATGKVYATTDRHGSIG